MKETHLDGPPPLARVLARGAAGSLRKRNPSGGARLPEQQLVLPAAAVDRARLARYAEVCGFPAGAALPVTYPHVLGFPLAMRLMAARDFPFPLLGLVHTGIEVVQRRPLHAEDRPEIRVHTEGAAPHRRGTVFDVVTEALLAGTQVWRSRSSYLCRHRTTTAQASATDTAGQERKPLPAVATWELPGDLGRHYAAASGDRNPIHLHPLTARLFGFPRAIAHGMWTFARCLAQAAAEDGGAAEELTATAAFKAPVLLPGRVGYGRDGETFELRGGRDGTRLHLTGRVAPSASPPSSAADPASRSS
jgi:acyl dehydratase